MHKIKVLASPCPSGESKRGPISLSFAHSRGCLYSLAHGLFLHIQNQQWCLSPLWPLLPSYVFTLWLWPFVVVVQSLSCVWLFMIPWIAACQAPLSSLSPGVCSDSCPLNQWCYLTISSSAALFFFPSIGVFFQWSAFHIRWPKYWSFSFSISLSNEYSGLISFRIIPV